MPGRAGVLARGLPGCGGDGFPIRLDGVENFGALGVEEQNVRRALNACDKLGSRGADLLTKDVKRARAVGDKQNRLAVGSPLVGTALPFVVRQTLEPAEVARFQIHIRYENRGLNVRANEDGVLSVGGHIDDRFPLRSAREAYGSAPSPSRSRIDFQRPHIGFALIRGLLCP